MWSDYLKEYHKDKPKATFNEGGLGSFIYLQLIYFSPNVLLTIWVFFMLDQSKTYAFDSRRIVPGNAFICLPNADGHVESALKNGATEVIRLSRPEFAMAAHSYFGYPTERVCMVGITGTNGKTSVAAFTAQLLRSLGHKVLVIGTLHSSLTTPEAWDALKKIKDHADDGGTHVVMEVSSHGIDQHRIDGFNFDIKCLTNITQDHLDYHGTFERYKQTKLSFMTNWPGQSVYLSDVIQIDASMIPQLRGAFHIQNASMALHICATLGESMAQLRSHLADLIAPLGRFQSIDVGQPFEVVVDFAHTPDALEHVLVDAVAIVNQDRSRVRLVMGCGGERDRSKRKKMGRIAEQYAEHVYLTADNSRSELTHEIVADIASGMRTTTAVNPNWFDRRHAISRAINDAKPQDIILVVGKGHETMQHCNGFSYGFNDADIAYSELIRQGHCQCTPSWGVNSPDGDVLFISKKTGGELALDGYPLKRTLPAPSNSKIREYMSKLKGAKVIVLESNKRLSMAGIIMCALRSVGRGHGYWFNEQHSLQYNLIGLTLIEQTDDPIIISVGMKFIRNARQIVQHVAPNDIVIGDILNDDGFVESHHISAIRRAIEQPGQMEWWYSSELIDVADQIERIPCASALKVQSDCWVDYIHGATEQLMNKLGLFLHSPRRIVQNQLMALGWLSKVVISETDTPVYVVDWVGDITDARQKMAYFVANAPVVFCFYKMPSGVRNDLVNINCIGHSYQFVDIEDKRGLTESMRVNSGSVHVIWQMVNNVPELMEAI